MPSANAPPKAVLSVIHHPVFGGPHNQALRLAPVLERHGIATTVLLPDQPGNAADRLRAAEIDVIVMPLHRLRATFSPMTQARFITGFWREVWSIRRLIRERSIDIVQIHGLVNPHGAIAARMEGIPIVWQLLDTRPPVALRRLMMPLVTRLADVVMSTGMEVARVHPGALGLGDRLVPFYPPVHTDSFQPDAQRRHAARAELGVPEDAHLIGTVGNLNPQKGHEYLVRAAAIVRREFPDVFVRILGAHTPTHASYESRLAVEARAGGLSDGTQLQFIDPGSRIAELLPAFDVFLLTSVPRSEGVPTTVLEAMACGLPVVATNVGAVREVVEDGVTGYVVAPLDPEAIAEATLRLLRDPGLRERMGRDGRARAVERFSVERCAEVHLKAYDHALRRRGHPGLLRGGQPTSQPDVESISSRSQA